MPALPKSAEEHAAAIALGADLRRLRRRRVLSQARLARLAEVDLATVQKIEKGRTMPRILTALRLAGALDVDLDELLETVQRRTGDRLPDHSSGPAPS